MSIRTLAVAFVSATEAKWLAPASARLAASLGAHLTGTHTAEPINVYGGGVLPDPVVLPDLLDWQKREAADIGAVFEAALTGEGIVGDFRFPKTYFATAEDFLLDSTRAADLVVIGRLSRHDWVPQASRLQDALIRRSGRPVLMMPPEQPLMSAPERVLIGVSATREATRAAHDALELAAPGAKIDLAGIWPGSEEEAFDIRCDMAAAFDRHGFATTLLDRAAAGGATGDALVQAARERGAQMLAVGAFAHSRLYDFVIGAVTSHLLEKSQLPVLFSK